MIYAYSHWTLLTCCFELFRYDYEKVDSAAADKMVERLNAFIADKATVGKEFTAAGKTFKVGKAEDFEYTDPIDKSVTKKQVGPNSKIRYVRRVWNISCQIEPLLVGLEYLCDNDNYSVNSRSNLKNHSCI